MSRYAVNSQELLFDSMGQLVGINCGYGFYSEHEWGYQGIEVASPASHNQLSGSGSFADTIISNPSLVRLLECGDGAACLTCGFDYIGDGELSDPQRRDEIIFGNRDVEEHASLGVEPEFFHAFWNSNAYLIYGKTDDANDALREIYSFIEAGTVSASADFTPLFSDRGLSFVITSRLDDAAIDDRSAEIDLDELMSSEERDLHVWLEENGNHAIGNGDWHDSEGAIWIGNVQADHVYDIDGVPVVYFYYEAADMPRLVEDEPNDWGYRRSNIDHITIRLKSIDNCMTRKGIEALVAISNDERYLVMWDAPQEEREAKLEELFFEIIGEDYNWVSRWRADDRYAKLR